MSKFKLKHSKGILKWMFLALFFFAVLEGLGLLFPILLQNITFIIQRSIDDPYASGVIGQIVINSALVLGFIVLIMLVHIIAEFFLAKYTNLYGASIRKELFDKFQKLSSEQIEKYGQGKIVPIILNDTNWARVFRQRLIRAFIFIPVALLGSIAMIFTLNWVYGLIALCAIPFIIVFYWYNIKKMNKIIPPSVEALDDYFTNVKEGITGARDIRILGKASERAEEFKKQVTLHSDQSQNADMRTNFSVSFNSILFTIITVIIILFAVHTEMSANDFQALVILNTSLQYLVRIQASSHTLFGWFFEHFPRYKITRKRIKEVLDMPETEADKGASQIPLFAEPKLEFANIEYHYPSGDRGIGNLNLQIPYNQRIAIAGGVGSGTRMLPKLLLRNEIPTSGEILLNNIDISTVNQNFLRREIFSYCSPHATFITASIRDNFRLLAPFASDEQILAAFDDLGAGDFVKRFGGNAEFLDYQIDNRKTLQLGIGTKNFLNVVRCILKPASIYIFNQSFEHINTEYISKLMSKLKRENRTCLFITYNATICRSCNKIHVMKAGRISASGKHADLLRFNTDYKKFYTATSGTITQGQDEVISTNHNNPLSENETSIVDTNNSVLGDINDASATGVVI
ncbi:MAG: ABC transporter ATP-binding protein/permease [Firmicutes bacterium]|nr:ABC transporter ATP-binding protein/permease [Bacillota bacterium]